MSSGVFDRVEAGLDRLVDGAQARYPWLLARLGSWLVAAWFAVVSLPLIAGYLADPDNRALDARLYVQASRAWLSGSNPWDVDVHGITYAAPPPSLLPTAVFTLLPTPWDWQVLAVLVVAASVLTVRMLRLPWWWLLFPPMVQGMMAGNVQMLLIPLILAGGGWVAGLLKAYAVVPVAILGRWRQLAVLAMVLLVTIPVLPWATYLASFPEINGRLAAQTGYGLSLTAAAVLFLPACVALWVVGRERAAWLAVPALWPAQQWYYASLAMPARSALVGAIIALPLTGSGAVALFALAVVEVLARRRRRRLQARAVPPVPPGDAAPVAASPAPNH